MPLYVGLISGTSMDGIDAAVVEIEGEAEPRARVRGAATLPYPAGLPARLRAAAGARDARSVPALDDEVGACFAAAALAACGRAGVPPSAIEAIGSHGQTVTHVPRVRSVQLGSARRIARETGRPVVHDFRRADIDAGGEGAPLAPIADWWTLRAPGRTTLALNLGGIANLSVVTWEREGVRGFDAGPANALLDALVRARLPGGEGFDRDGALARAGRARDDLLERWEREDPFLAAPPPKSTGTDRYGDAWIASRLAEVPGVATEDLAATLCRFTAGSVARAVERWCRTDPPATDLVVSGGGARNPAMMDALREEVPSLHVVSSAERGLDPDFREAVLFALLAWAHIRGIPGNLPAVTGASRTVVLGRRVDAAPPSSA